MLKQRLLYLSSESTHPESEVISSALYEPLYDAVTEIDPSVKAPIYESVRDALVDGWRVVCFPDQREPSDIDIIGYQFILEKMEKFDD